MKKYCLGILTALFVTISAFSMTSVSAEIVESGKMNGLTWTLDDEGTLTISGEGDMVTYTMESKWPTVKTVNIEAGVTSVDSDAFKGCKNLETVTIADSVTVIDLQAFYNCSALKSVVMPEQLTKIGQSAFYGCTSLKEITIPENVATINCMAFYNCTALEKMYWNAKSVELSSEGQDTFENLGSAGKGVELVFGDTVQKIPDNMMKYSDNVNIKSITIGENVTTVGYNAFRGCTKVEKVYWNAINVTDSDSTGYTGSECGGMDAIFGDNVETIPYNCFSHAGLKSVTIGKNVTEIGKYAFSGNGGLTTVSLPDSVTTIGDYAFQNCSGLTKVSANKISDIGIYSFSGCTALKTIDFIMNAESIGSSAFSGCTALTKISVSNKLKNVDSSAFYGCSNIKEIYWDCESGVTPTGWCTSGEEVKVIFGDSITKVPCVVKGLTAPMSVTIGKNVTEISDYAFQGCTGLSSIVIPNGVETIGSYAFSGTGITEIRFPDSVTSFGADAFADCKSLTKIEFPKNIEKIKGFSGCSALEEIVVPAKVISLGDFSDCKSLRNVIITGPLKNIGSSAFAYCSSLERIVLPKGLEAIGAHAFDHTGIKSIVIPDSVTYIGSYAFNECDALIDIKLSKNITYISGHTFFGCGALKSIRIPDGVTTIYNNAFYKCSSIEEIVIPKTLEKIGGYAFYSCSGIKNVYYMGDASSWAGIEINTANGNLTYSNRHYAINVNYVSKDKEYLLDVADKNSEALVTSNVPNRVGHTLLGWSTQQNASSAQYQPGDSISAGETDITLYAVWKKTSYTTTSKSGSKFVVKPTGVSDKSDLIFVCYKDGKVADVKRGVSNADTAMEFVPEGDYDEIKVFTWGALGNMIPLTEPEAVDL